jgi:hypothetical protein
VYDFTIKFEGPFFNLLIYLIYMLVAKICFWACYVYNQLKIVWYGGMRIDLKIFISFECKPWFALEDVITLYLGVSNIYIVH